MFGFVKKLFGDSNEKELKRMQTVVDAVNALEPDMQKLSDASLTGKTREFKERLEKGETLDEIMPEAFAAVREASKRTPAAISASVASSIPPPVSRTIFRT